MKQCLLILFLFAILLQGCKEEEKPDPRKRYKYNVFLRIPGSQRAFYANSTIGLGSCAILGRRTLLERASHELTEGNWEVICCWWTENSECQEEHRFQDKDIPYEEWLKDPKYHHIPERQYFFKPRH